MDDRSHPRNEHVSKDGAQEGHGHLLHYPQHSGGCPNMEFVLEVKHAQLYSLMCPYHSVGSRTCYSLRGKG